MKDTREAYWLVNLKTGWISPYYEMLYPDKVYEENERIAKQCSPNLKYTTTPEADVAEAMRTKQSDA